MASVMGGGQRQSSPQRGKAESEHENPFAQALEVSLTHSTKTKKRCTREGGAEESWEVQPSLTEAAACNVAAPKHPQPQGPGCGDLALGSRTHTQHSPTTPGWAWASSAARPWQRDTKK